MRIDIQLIPIPPDPKLLSSRAVVVVDVLRATSAMVHAISEGALEILPVTTVKKAFEAAGTFPPGTILLGGEEETQRIEGFDLGNSPKEYIAERVKDKRLVMKTTNGTQAFGLVSSGLEIMAGSFFNINATAERCMELGTDLLLFPSGDEGNFSLEDTLCAGMLIDLILRGKGNQLELSDASHCAHALYQRFRGTLVEAFRLSRHGKELIRFGLEDDLSYCAQVDLTRVVPIYKGGVIRSFGG